MLGIPARLVRAQAMYDDRQYTAADRVVPAVLGQFGPLTLHCRHHNGPQRRFHGGAGAFLHRRDNGTATPRRSVLHRWRLPQRRHHAGVLHRCTNQLADDGVPQRPRPNTHLPHTFSGKKRHSMFFFKLIILNFHCKNGQHAATNVTLPTKR